MGSASIDTSSSGIGLGTNESLNTLTNKLIGLIEEATFSDFDDDDMGSGAAIIRRQASAPSSVEYDFWADTTLDRLRVYSGPSAGNRWVPVDGSGESMVNNTGASRSAGDVVSFSGSVGDNEFDADPSDGSGNPTTGVLQESAIDSALGLVQMGGHVTTVKVDGTVGGGISIGDYLTISTSAGAYMVATGGSTLAGSCGVALEASSSQNTIEAIIWPYNG